VIDERIASRRADVRQERRRARLRRTLVGVLVIALMTTAVWFERSEWAAIETVTVLGAERLDAADVLAASGLRVGEPALRVRPRAVAARVAGIVLVREASVRRDGPRRLVLEIREREPVYVVVAGRVELLVDRDGVVIDDGSLPGLPVVRITGRAPSVGGTVVADAALANAHRVWTGLSGPLRVQVKELRAPDEDGLELLLHSGLTVRFGRAERLEEKVRAVGVVLDDVAGTDVTFIDVRVPSFPVVGFD